MIERGDQRIICPGCGRTVYLEIKIMGHNHNRPLDEKQKKKLEEIREERARRLTSLYD
jgi:sarcosine oxidase delta subunit